MRFINYADENRILLVFLPPRSTHRLQLLNIRLFGSLTQYYTQEIDRFIAEYQGYIIIFNRHFWIFVKVYARAFTE